MNEDVVTALVENDINLAKTIIGRDDEVDRLDFLLVRLLQTTVSNPHLSEKRRWSSINCLDYRLIVSVVESIGGSF